VDKSHASKLIFLIVDFMDLWQ